LYEEYNLRNFVLRNFLFIKKESKQTSLKIKIHRAIILPVFCVGARVDLSP